MNSLERLRTHAFGILFNGGPKEDKKAICIVNMANATYRKK